MIYFIKQNNEYVKIGYTKNNPDARLASLQVGNLNPLVLHQVIHGGEAKEAALHTRFGIYHVRGEWYWLSREIRRHIDGQPSYNIDMTRYIKDNSGVVAILNNKRR